MIFDRITFSDINSDVDLRYRLLGNVGPYSNPNERIPDIATNADFGHNASGMMAHPKRTTHSMRSNLDGKYLLEQIIR